MYRKLFQHTASSSLITAKLIGHIIDVAAVLLIHIDRNIVANVRPKLIL